jgi:rhomboid family GlyGly-CTERM serine protease
LLKRPRLGPASPLQAQQWRTSKQVRTTGKPPFSTFERPRGLKPAARWFGFSVDRFSARHGVQDRWGHWRAQAAAAARRPGCVSLLLSAAAVLIWISPSATSALQYDRSALAAGELWRIVSCHLTHFSLEHLFWDVLMFAVIGTLCERRSSRRFLACLAGAAVVIPAAVWLLQPGLEIYRGLSGLDSALFVLLGVQFLREQAAARHRTGVAAAVLLLLAFGAKITFESVTGAAVFVADDAMVPVPLAHVAGGSIGLVFGLVDVPSRFFASRCCVPREVHHVVGDESDAVVQSRKMPSRP